MGRARERQEGDKENKVEKQWPEVMKTEQLLKCA